MSTLVHYHRLSKPQDLSRYGMVARVRCTDVIIRTRKVGDATEIGTANFCLRAGRSELKRKTIWKVMIYSQSVGS
jgi:hypothetical protein